MRDNLTQLIARTRIVSGPEALDRFLRTQDNSLLVLRMQDFARQFRFHENSGRPEDFWNLHTPPEGCNRAMAGQEVRRVAAGPPQPLRDIQKPCGKALERFTIP
jgi:hypothetical protein